MADTRPSMAVLGGWGVSPAILSSWLETLRGSVDIHVVDVPDLDTGQLLSVEERSERLLQSAPSNSYWLGWSLGGAIALDLASHSPQAIRGVITLATNPCFVGQSDWPRMDAATFASFLQAYSELPTKTLQRFASLQVVGAAEPRAQLRALKANLLESQVVLGQLLGLLAIDRREQLGGLEVPALMILADSDSLVPVELAAVTVSQLPEIDLRLIESSSHLLFKDQPKQLTASVLDWLGRLESIQDAR